MKVLSPGSLLTTLCGLQNTAKLIPKLLVVLVQVDDIQEVDRYYKGFFSLRVIDLPLFIFLMI